MSIGDTKLTEQMSKLPSLDMDPQHPFLFTYFILCLLTLVLYVILIHGINGIVFLVCIVLAQPIQTNRQMDGMVFLRGSLISLNAMQFSQELYTNSSIHNLVEWHSDQWYGLVKLGMDWIGFAKSTQTHSTTNQSIHLSICLDWLRQNNKNEQHYPN